MKGRQVITAIAVAPFLVSCYLHQTYATPEHLRDSRYASDVRVQTVSGNVFMLRSAAVVGDSLAGNRIFCRSGQFFSLQNDNDWCKGVTAVPRDSARIAIPFSDIRQALTRSLDPARTIGAVVVSCAFAVLVALAPGQ